MSVFVENFVHCMIVLPLIIWVNDNTIFRQSYTYNNTKDQIRSLIQLDDLACEQSVEAQCTFPQAIKSIIHSPASGRMCHPYSK